METKIDINKAFTFVFEDKDWIKKILIAGALYLTMIGAIPVLGWALEIQRRVIREEEEDLLPDWQYIGIFTLDGLKFILVNLVWMSPIIVSYFGGVSIFFNYLFNSPGEIERAVGSFYLFSIILSPVFMLVMFFIYSLYPIISGVLVDTDSIREALRITRVWKLYRSNFWQCFGVAFLSFVVSYAASMAGMFLFFIGMFFTAPIGMAIMFHLFGQAYRNAVIKSSQEKALTKT